MEKNWINIFSSTDFVYVEILKHILFDNNIQAVSINQKDSSYLMFGTIDVYVKAEQEKLAQLEEVAKLKEKRIIDEQQERESCKRTH